MKSNRTVTIECEAGYTTNGSASGPVSSEVECVSSGGLAPVSSCIPLECGPAHNFNHSTNSHKNKTVVFNNSVVYTCQRRYFVDFTEKQFQFEVNCSEECEFTTLSESLPADCGEAPEPRHSSNKKKSAVFPERVEYACGEGYTLDGTSEGMSGFESHYWRLACILWCHQSCPWTVVLHNG